MCEKIDKIEQLTKKMTDNYVEQYLSKNPKRKIYGLRFGTVNGYSPNFRNDIMINAMNKLINRLLIK